MAYIYIYIGELIFQKIYKDFKRICNMLEVKVDYAIGEFIYMLPSDMNLWIGKIENYNNKILA